MATRETTMLATLSHCVVVKVAVFFSIVAAGNASAGGSTTSLAFFAASSTFLSRSFAKMASASACRVLDF